MGFDTVFLIIITLAFFYGFIRGFIRQLLSLAGLFVAGYMALYQYHKAYSILSPYISNPNVLKITSIGLTFIVVYLVFALASTVISFMIKGAIGFIDRLLGGLFAVTKALVFLMALSLLLIGFKTTREFVLRSNTGPYLAQIGASILNKGINIWEERWNSEKNLKKK